MATITVQIPAGPIMPHCVSCHEDVEDVLAVRLWYSDEVRMYHYLCPNGVQEVVFRPAHLPAKQPSAGHKRPTGRPTEAPPVV